MVKIIRMRRERPRQTNIDIVRNNPAKLYQNDILASIKTGRETPRVPVQFGDELELNRPCINLEDVPTGCMKVDSPLAELQDSLESSIRESQEKSDKTVEDNPF